MPLNKRIENIPIPERMRNLPLSDEGFPVPWFVPLVDGKPEFRAMGGEKLSRAIRLKRCWLCGEQLGKFMTFVIGPMCAVTRTTAEPPCHKSCAEYAVKACPFLTQPRMRRNEKDLPEHGNVAGIMISRNPGVALLWTTQNYRIFNAGGVLFKVGDPISVDFWAEGRKATREEIMKSIESGLPILRDMAKEDGPEGVADLEEKITATMTLLPK